MASKNTSFFSLFTEAPWWVLPLLRMMIKGRMRVGFVEK
jgi:hypothetical protein